MPMVNWKVTCLPFAIAKRPVLWLRPIGLGPDDPFLGLQATLTFAEGARKVVGERFDEKGQWRPRLGTKKRLYRHAGDQG